jgi:NAD(P)-dependent dehydrogenase (short-subunit alcohol dehydrogenase family)
VTGGSRGIGRKRAPRLAADGLAVVVGYVGNKEKAEETVATAIRAGVRAIAVQADVADEDAVTAMFDTAERGIRRRRRGRASVMPAVGAGAPVPHTRGRCGSITAG